MHKINILWQETLKVQLSGKILRIEGVGNPLVEAVDGGEGRRCYFGSKEKKDKKKSKDNHLHKLRREEALVANENVARESSSTNASSVVLKGFGTGSGEECD